MSRVINFLSGNSATFNSGIGDWVISSGAATLSASKEKQKLSAFGSLKVSPTNAASVVVADTQSIPADYLGWPIKFSYWAYSDISRNVTTTIAVTGDTTTRTTGTFLQGGIWSLIVVQQPLPTTVFGSQASCTIQISLAATATVAPVYISAPVLSTPDAIVYNTFNRETYELLPEYLRIEDKKQINPTLPLLRFMDVAFMETADLWDLWESIRYIAPDEYGVAEETSALVDPEKAPVAWLYWLAMILGFKFQTSAAGISSWGSLLTALDADSSGNLSWGELLGIDNTATWAELEAAAPNNTGVESDLRWQVALGVYGINAGTKSAVITAVKHVLTGTQQVAVNNFASGDPWKMEIVTITSETPDVVGGSSPTVLEAAFGAVPVGYEVTHRCVSAGEMVLEQAVLWLDAKYSTVGETTMANRGTGGPMLDAAYGAGASAPVVISHTGTNHLYFPGTTTNYATLQDTPELRITGDMELICRIAPASWTGAARVIMSKWGATAPVTLGWTWQIASTGQLQFYVSTAGNNQFIMNTSTWSVPSAGSARWLKLAYTASTGTTQFYEAADSAAEPSTWTFIQSSTNASATSIYATPAPLEIGSQQAGTSNFFGKHYRAIVKRGTGASATVVADCNFMTGITTGDQTTFSYSGNAASTGVVFSGVKNIGIGGDSLNGIIGTSALVDSFDPVWLARRGANYLYTTGISGNHAAVPHNSLFWPTSSISYRFAAALTDWTPGALTYFGGHFTAGASARSSLCGVNTNGTLFMQLSSDGTNATAFASTVAPTFIDTVLYAVRMDWVASPTPTVRFFTKSTTESTAHADCDSDVGWVQLGADVTSGVFASLYQTLSEMYVASHPAVSTATGIKHYSTIVKVDATTRASVNFATGITGGAQTTFIESAASATVTISRSASGYKSVAVASSCWLIAATDQITIPSYSTVKFMASDSMTAIVALRQWGATRVSGGYVISNRGATGLGWQLQSSGTTYQDNATVVSSGGTLTIAGPASSSGALAVKGIVLDRSLGRLYSTNASTSASTNASAVTSLEVTQPIVIGARGDSSSGTDGEFFGAAIWNRALTSAELQTIDSHYNGTVTGESTALLQSAIVWLDAGLSAPTGGLVRSASGARLMAVTRPTLLFSTNDFLQIDDNALLDFNASETFTVLIAVRNWSASANGIYWIGKRESTGASVGWQLRASASTTDVSIILDDGPSFTATTNPLWFGGETLVAVGVVNRSTAQAISAIGSRAGTAASTSSFGNVASAAPLLIGTYQGVFMDAEFLGAAIFAGTLTSAQLDSVVTYFRSSL